MKKLFIISFVLVALIAFSQSSYALSVTLTEFTGDDAEVLLEVTGEGTNSITFNVEVVNPEFADIEAVFFEFDPYPFDGENYEDPSHPAGLSVVGDDVTGWQFFEDGVYDLGNGKNINGDGGEYTTFDSGIAIGLSGLRGEAPIMQTSFTLEYTEALFLGDLFGARLTSVNENGSSKLVGNYEPVPEPSTVFLLGLGLLGVIGLGRKIKK